MINGLSGGMDIVNADTPRYWNANPSWCDKIFASKSALTGGVVRRAVRDVEREVGRHAFIAEVTRRHFHLIECSGQFIVICSDSDLKVLA